jgi:hypothetical protein
MSRAGLIRGLFAMRIHLSSRMRRSLTIAAEIALALAIIALLIATWLPAFIGAPPMR